MINQVGLSVRRSDPTAMRPILLALALSAVAPVAAQEVSARVEDTESGERLLIHEVVVPATGAQLWAAFPTAEGFMGWAAPFAVDLRIGGSAEPSCNPDGGTRVVMYGVGVHDTPEHRAVLDLFRADDVWTLRSLFSFLTDGPIDWVSALGGG